MCLSVSTEPKHYFWAAIWKQRCWVNTNVCENWPSNTIKPFVLLQSFFTKHSWMMTRLSWQPNTISQGWSTWSRLIKITIRFMLSITQTWLILIIWSVEKRASEMLDCAANVSFCRSAGEARRTGTSNVLLQRLSFHFCLLGCLFISFSSAWEK